jgi:hypothetical protein
VIMLTTLNEVRALRRELADRPMSGTDDGA